MENAEIEVRKIYPDAKLTRDNRNQECWINDGHGIIISEFSLKTCIESKAWESAYEEFNKHMRFKTDKYNNMKDLKPQQEPKTNEDMLAPSEGRPVPVAPMGRWAQNEEAYIGTKVIRAMPMSEDKFLIAFKGKTAEELRMQETQGDGYKVTYEDGYVSWSPKATFERCYRKISFNEKGLI